MTNLHFKYFKRKIYTESEGGVVSQLGRRVFTSLREGGVQISLTLSLVVGLFQVRIVGSRRLRRVLPSRLCRPSQ